MRAEDALNRVAALVQSDQGRTLADGTEVRRLEATVEGMPALPRSRRRRLRWLLLTGFAVPAFAVVMGVIALGPRALSYQAAGVVSRAGMKLETGEDQTLPLHFSDGSVVTLASGSQAEVIELSGRGAKVRLSGGTLTAAVVHADRTRWTVGAGPYLVNVTGTRFTAAWDPRHQRLRVALTEGSVVVQGPMLGATGLPLERGQALTVDVGQQKVELSPMVDLATAEPTMQVAQSIGGTLFGDAPASAMPVPAPRFDSWRRWALASHPREALAAANRAGFNDLCRVLPAADLLLLADAARFAKDAPAATTAFAALRERFPNDERTGDAVFGLGVLALDADERAVAAAAWFEEYLARWSDGPLAREAHGRLIEALDRTGRGEEAALKSTSYLARFGDGPHAALARRLLAAKR